jgi:formylglycine-generating enzyme required for sulfatase activity
LLIPVFIACIWITSVSADEIVISDVAFIAGGTFVMGTAATNISKLKSRYDVVFPGVFENEIPAHEVTISDFRIDKFEVTNARFKAFLVDNPEWLPENVMEESQNGDYLASWQDGQYPDEKGDRPVVFVTWAAAQSFCHWSGGRLPTEAEWEYVARSGDNREFPWGDSLPAPTLANYGASDIDHTTPVGRYPPNDFGVYDLAGNVWEFLYDEWQPEYRDHSQSDPVAGDWLNEDEILAVTGRRTVRGASYGGSVVNLRTRWRDSHVVSNAIEFVGFRCAYPK